MRKVGTGLSMSLDAPVFVVTHAVPEGWGTDGVERAIERAKAVAGEKIVGVAAGIAQPAIKAGLLDEIHIDLVPALLGNAIRSFEHLGTEPTALEPPRAIVAPGVARLAFRVVQ